MAGFWGLEGFAVDLREGEGGTLGCRVWWFRLGASAQLS